MTQTEWKISDRETIVDASLPAKGVHYRDAFLLGVCAPEFCDSAENAILEQFKHDDRLTVRYAGTDAWPIWTEVTWDVYETRDRPGLTIDLNVSVRTNQPTCRPELVAQSFFPKSECFAIKDCESRPIELNASVPHTMTRADATGCVLFRPADADWSLVEMVHPQDFEHDELSHDPEHPDHTRLSHRLFINPLEKGVLLRARLRTIVLDRAGDLETAAIRYTEFTHEPPVL